MCIKLFFISGSYPPVRCGVGDYLYNLTSELSSLGDTDIYVITSDYRNVSRRNRNPAVYPIINNWHNINKIYVKIAKMIKLIKPHIMHFQYPTKEYERGISISLLPSLIKIRFPKIKIVVTFHEPLFQYHSKAKIKYVSALLPSDGLIFVEKEYYNFIPWFQKPIVKSKFIKYIPVASNIPNVWLSNRGVNNLRAKLNIEKDELLVVYFGAITKYKGLESVIEIVERFNAKFLIISQLNSNDQYHSYLRRFFEKEGLLGRITITGFLQPIEVAKRLYVADVCIFPHVRGVSPKSTSFLAAISQGVFTIATSKKRQGYNPEKNLYYVAPGDTAKMIKAIDKYAGRRIKPDFEILPNWYSIALEHRHFYHDIINK